MQDEYSDIGSTGTIVYDADAIYMMHSNQESRESWQEVLQADAGRHRQQAVEFSQQIHWDVDTGCGGEVRGTNFQEPHWAIDDASVPDLDPSSSSSSEEDDMAPPPPPVTGGGGGVAAIHPVVAENEDSHRSFLTNLSEEGFFGAL